MWLCIVAAYVFTSLLLWIFDKFSPYSYSNNREKYRDDPEKREFNLKECLWFCMTSLTPQGRCLVMVSDGSILPTLPIFIYPIRILVGNLDGMSSLLSTESRL